MRRLATPADLEAVYAIYMHASVVPFLGFDPMPLKEFRAVYDELLSTRSFYIFESEGVLAGFYEVSRQPGRAAHVAQLGTVALAPALAGRGLGRAMLEEAIARLRAAGVIRVELLVEADNARALGFYRKLGFELEGRMRRAYKRAGEAQYVDELVMTRFLD